MQSIIGATDTNLLILDMFFNFVGYIDFLLVNILLVIFFNFCQFVSIIIHYTKRLVKNHNPKAIVVFVANDITGSNNNSWYGDLRPREVLKLFKFFTKQVYSAHADIPIFVIETTPTISRWKVWNKISAANDLIKNYTEKEDNLSYITTRFDFLDNEGNPVEKYFIRDKLHLNNSGYKLWSKIIKNTFKKKL